MTIRGLQKTDLPDTLGLLRELGYAISEEFLSTQIAAVLSHKDHCVFVAEKNESIVGLIHGVKSLRLTSAPFIEIVALVVSVKERRQGIARKLVADMEKWAKSSDHSIRVRCNTKRKSAHQFYDNLSFTEKKEQKVYEKHFHN